MSLDDLQRDVEYAERMGDAYLWVDVKLLRHLIDASHDLPRKDAVLRSFARRIAAQSELLSQKAERK